MLVRLRSLAQRQHLDHTILDLHGRTRRLDHRTMLRDELQESFGLWAEALTGAIEDAVRAGQVDPSLDPQSTAQFLLSAWEGALITARTSRSAGPFDAFFSNVFDRLLAPPPAA